MVKTELKILKHENKTSQGGKDYTRFNCEYVGGQTKWLSAFESDVIEKCRANEGKFCELEVAESEKDGKIFYNIRGFYNVSSDEERIDKTPIKPQDAFNTERKSVKGSAYEKDPVGLAVELRANDPKLTIEEAIAIVKQAQEAFS